MIFGSDDSAFDGSGSATRPIRSGNQLIEAIRTHDKKITKKQAFDESVEMLRKVGFNEPEKRIIVISV